MSTALGNDMKFMGESTHPGGQFRDIRVVGRTRMDGDVTCRSFSCMGEARLGGGLQSGETRILGQASVAGAVDGGDCTVLGQLECAASLRVRKLNCTGQVKVKGQVDAEKIKIYGQMVVQGDCNVDDFGSNGAFDIAGLLSVDSLLVHPNGPCKAAEIGGARIEVRRRVGFLGNNGMADWIHQMLPGSRSSRLEAQTIEGDEIILEDSVVGTVRGGRVQIGRGCRIGIVEYRDSYTCEPGSEVGEARQV
jgi:cytoskeletal protein CcmA (bactofilin family)